MGEERVLQEIKRWEEEMRSFQANDFETLHDEWIQHNFSKIPERLRGRFFESVDQWLLYTYTFVQNTNSHTESTRRIFQTARAFDETIDTYEDLKKLSIEQLTFLADQHVARNRLYSFVQGGLTGAGGFVFLAADLPLIVGLNLRSIQLIGTSFGYHMNNPIEMLIALKVFHAGILPRRFQAQAWDELKEEVKDLEDLMAQEDVLTDEKWLAQPLQHIFKLLFIVSFRKKLFQGIPLISAGIGASYNYKLSRQLTDFAKRFYQYRLLEEKRAD